MMLAKTMTCKTTTFEWGTRTYIMGVLNMTPDSFSGDGLIGKEQNPSRGGAAEEFAPAVDKAVEIAKMMASSGADIIDIGGESSRPGAEPVSVDEEKRRVIPVIKRLAGEIRAPISIDTYHSEVAYEAIIAGATIINDISGLRADRNMARTAARQGVPVIIMHMKGTPRTMQVEPRYKALIPEIKKFFTESIAIAKDEGVTDDKIIIDPGIGFGKTMEHNLSLVKHLSEFKSLGYPVLVGVSRKSFIGRVLGDIPVGQRLHGTAAAVAIAIANGADIVRVHDVSEMAHVARMTDAIVRAQQ